MIPTIDFCQIPSACFLMDEHLLMKNLELLKRVQQESGAKIILALKGFSMFSTFPLIRQYLPGTTASSLNEARLGSEEFGGEVHAYCVAYTDDEISKFIEICNHITFNSIAQWQHFKKQIERNPQKVSCGLRINPEYSEVETPLYNPCIPGSRLGVTAAHFGEQLPEGIEGLHFHNLCEKDSFALERTLVAIEKKFAHLLKQCTWVNFGGGHLITRSDYDVEHLISVIKKFKEKYDVEVILEPGSAIAWRTGYLVSTVLDLVESGGESVAILDVSISAHMPDCIEMPYNPGVLGAKLASKNEKGIKLGGLTCLAGDYIGDYIFEKPLAIGDKVVFEDMMHYTMVKTTMFNGVKHPDLGIWKKDGKFQLIRSFTYEDYRSRLS